MMPREQLLSWGWRIPFLISFLLIGLGLYIRARVQETPVFAKVEQSHTQLRAPVLEAMKRHPRNFLLVLGARFAENGLGYLFGVFGLGYVVTTLGQPRPVAIAGVMAGYIVAIFTIPFFSWLSDRVGRRPIYMFGALFSAAMAFPFFWLTGTKDPLLIQLAFVLVTGVGSAAMFGPQAAYFAELFGPRLRYSGFAFARELGSVLAGGPAPFVAALLVAWAGGAPWGVACYIVLLSAITVFALWMGPETHTSDIDAEN